MKISKPSVIAGVVLVGCAIYGIFFKRDHRIVLKEKRTEIVIGKITRGHFPNRAAGYYLDYRYVYEGEQLTGTMDITDIITSPKRFVNKFFPVVLNKDDVDESVMLLTPKDFAMFNQTFPDSLEWVIQFSDKSRK